MKILKIVGIVLAVIIMILVIIGLVTPKDYDIKRDIVINAPPETVFHTVSHYSEFKKWSPWEKLDTNMTTTLDGTDGTVGAKYSWKGNDKVGQGSMTIVKLEQDKIIEHELYFIEPFESRSTTYMNLEPVEGGTKATWGMRGESGFVTRVMMTLMGGMDGAVGKDYEKGLANLKTLCESAPAPSAYKVSDIDWTEKNTLSVRKTVEFKDLPDFFSIHYPKMFQEISKAGAKPGIPLAVYYKYDEAAGNTDVAAAIPYEGGKVASKEYAALNLPAAKGYTMDYYGPYNEEMMKPYKAMDVKLKELGKTHPTYVIEEYVTDPMTEKDSTKWYTKIYFFTE